MKLSEANESNSQPKGLRLAVVGAGISGLSALYRTLRLAPSHLPLRHISVYEATDRAGGLIASHRVNGFLVEEAAHSILMSRESFVELVNELNISDQLVFPQDKNPGRFLFAQNTLVRLSPLAVFSKALLGIRGVLRALMEPFIPLPAVQDPQESLYRFIARRFGERVAQRLVVPMTIGIWAGGARHMVARHVFPSLVEGELRAGSVLRALWKRPRPKKKPDRRMASFREGMETLPKALFHAIETLCQEKGIVLEWKWNTPLTQLSPKAGGGAIVNGSPYEGVLLSVSPLRLVGAFAAWPQMHTSLEVLSKRQKSHSIAAVALGGKAAPGAAWPKGFGALQIPPTSGFLATIFSHSLFPGHTPEGSLSYRVMLGGEFGGDEWVEQPPERLKDAAKASLAERGLLPEKQGFALEHVVAQRSAIPLMGPEHDDYKNAIQTLEGMIPGLVCVGNHLQGAGVADCIENSFAGAKKILERLHNFV